MKPERFKRARELFDQAWALPMSEQEAFLTQQCAGDTGLRDTVNELFRRAALQQADKPQADGPDPGDRLLGSQIGPYQIRGLLGQGGMGAVYEAIHERTKQVVALKLVRPGLTTPELLRRFEFELKVLARLEHPGIARIYHADTADVGGGAQPYFAMELVRGENLVQFAAGQKLTIRQRLELAAKIADAVQYAHQQGVIHRDLKPGNIVVTADGQPKVLDFGVARATDSDVKSTTLQTDIGQLIGTLPYMSPEQTGGDPSQIDTRSDVYALGVVIYELLTGRLPYALEKRMIHEAVRVIREEEPTRLSSLNKTLRGDVETIVGKALEKDKARRYATANALANDIRRHLNHEPISARPPSASDQLGKFVRRNKVLVSGLAATFVALVAGLIGTGLALDRALKAESREREERGKVVIALGAAERARAQAEKNQKLAEQRAEETKQVADFLEGLLAQVDPATAGARLSEDVNRRYVAALEERGVSEADRVAKSDAFRQEWLRVNTTDAALALIDETILKPAAESIDAKFKDQPVVAAQLRQVLVLRYMDLGRHQQALSLQDAVLDTRRRVLGQEHPETLDAIRIMGDLLINQGRPTEAEPYTREALEKRRRVLGDEHPETLISLNAMGRLLHAQGKLSEAEPYYQEALDKSRRVLGEEHWQTLSFLNDLALLFEAQGSWSRAEPYYRDVLEKRRRVLGEEHPHTLLSMNNMGYLLQALGRLAEAEPYYREALAMRRRKLGEEHPSTLASVANLASLLRAQGKLAEAEPYYREALEKSKRVLGEEHPRTLSAANNLGLMLGTQDKLAEAESYLREALEKSRRVQGQEHPDTLNSVINVAALLWKQERPAEAESFAREAVDGYRRVAGEHHPSTLHAVSTLGVVLRDQNKLAEAEPYLRLALDKRRGLLGEEHPSTLISITNLGGLLLSAGNYQEAVDLLAPTVPAVRKTFTGDNSNRLAALLLGLGEARASLPYQAERFSAAEADLIEAHDIFIRTPGRQDRNIRGCVQSLIALYNAWDQAAPGQGYHGKAAEWRARLQEWQSSTQPAASQPAGTRSSQPSDAARSGSETGD